MNFESLSVPATPALPQNNDECLALLRRERARGWYEAVRVVGVQVSLRRPWPWPLVYEDAGVVQAALAQIPVVAAVDVDGAIIVRRPHAGAREGEIVLCGLRWEEAVARCARANRGAGLERHLRN